MEWNLVLWTSRDWRKPSYEKLVVTRMKGGTFFSISASDLMSKYVGELEENFLSTFFQWHEDKDRYYFHWMKLDSIVGERSSEENEVSRRVKT